MAYQLPNIFCVNCKREIPRKMRAPKNVQPKSCPWCSKPVAPRASNRKMQRSR